MKKWLLISILSVIVLLVIIIMIPLKGSYEISAQVNASPLVVYKTLQLTPAWEQWYAKRASDTANRKFHVHVASATPNTLFRYNMWEEQEPGQNGEVVLKPTPDGGTRFLWKLQLDPGFHPSLIVKTLFHKKEYERALKESVLNLINQWSHLDTLAGVAVSLMRVAPRYQLEITDTVPAATLINAFSERRQQLQEHLATHHITPAGDPVSKVGALPDAMVILTVGIPVKEKKMPLGERMELIMEEPYIAAVGQYKSTWNAREEGVEIVRQWVKLRSLAYAGAPWVVHHYETESIKDNTPVVMDVLQPVYYVKPVYSVY
jgi:hypothetical protein